MHINWSLLEADTSRRQKSMCNANSKEDISHLKERYAKRPLLEFHVSKRDGKHML
jgi:hypothetical protein